MQSATINRKIRQILRRWQVVQANDSERAAPRRLYFLGIELDDARNHAMAVMFVHRYLAAG